MRAKDDQVLQLLAQSIDSTEGIAADNHRRVLDHVTRFGEALGLSEAEQDVLERGALVHDIGKIKISTDVLVKSNVLTYDDWQLLRSHTSLGADLIKGVESLSDTEDVVRYHHECWDGDGYPEGLKGAKIPHLAHIMKIVDVYCAMTSARHYRDGESSHEEAIAYFKEEHGKHFNPELVDVFIDKNIGKPVA